MSTDKDIVFELIGKMLHPYVLYFGGVVEVSLPGEHYFETFWCESGLVQRVRRGDIPCHEGDDPNDWGDDDPDTVGIPMTYAGRMLQPAKALIWGYRPDEWRLTSDWAREGEDLYRIRLTRPDAPHAEGSILVDRRSGILREMVKEDRRAVVRRLDLFPPGEEHKTSDPSDSRDHPAPYARVYDPDAQKSQ